MSTRFFLNKENSNTIECCSFNIVPPRIDMPREIKIRDIKVLDKDKQIFSFSVDGINDKNILSKLEGLSLLVDLNNVNKEKIFKYSCDLDKITDLELIDDNLGYIGKVVSIESSDVQDILIVKYEKKEIMVPYVKEIVYKKEGNKLFAKLPDGLLDL